MALFRRRGSEPGRHPVPAFWDWWNREGHRIDPTRMTATADELSRRVAAIHPDLGWHFGAGSTSRHCLTVSSGGVAELRPVAERWLRAAPPADDTWEFRSSQQPDPDALTNRLEIGGARLDLSETRFDLEVAPDELRVHLGVHHPGFAALPEEVRAHVSYLLLDWLLGEDDVERWVGRVEPLTTVPGTPRTGSDVREAVAGLAASRDPDDWAIARWEGPDGSPGLALFRRGTRWVDHPVLDRHQVLTVGYDAQENGLPADGAVLDALRTLEDELEGLLGGRGILLAHESNRGTRTFHAYTDGEDQNVDALVQEWAARRGVGVSAGDDPAWTEVRHFTG